MVKKILIIGIPVVVVFCLIAVFGMNSKAKDEDILRTVAVEKSSIIDKALAVGKIEPKREIGVKSKVAGIVRTTYVDVGDHVDVGDPLFDVKPDPTPVEFANAKREVELCEVTFDKVRREFDRATQLRDKQLISHQEFEAVQARYEESELRMKLSREKLALIESGHTEVADRTVDNIIKSPITGTVLSLLVEVGDPVVPLTSYQAGTELMTLAQMDDLVFKGTVDEIDVGKLLDGMPAEIEIGALPNENVSGKLDRISPKARQNEGATVFDVEIVFDQFGQNFLRAGYSANADIIINKREDILVIPERLVTMTDTANTVEVQDSLGEVATRIVETGLSDGINIEIVSGVTEGEMIVERPPREIKPWD